MRRPFRIVVLALLVSACGGSGDDDDDDDDDSTVVDAAIDAADDAPIDGGPIADPCNGCEEGSTCVILFGGTCEVLSAECVETDCGVTCTLDCEAELCIDVATCDYSCENEPETPFFGCYGP